MPGTVADKFTFTVRDAAVAARINANIGERLVMHYEQHKWLPTSCYGDTEYFVTSVAVAGAPQPLPGAVMPVPAPAPAAPAQTVPQPAAPQTVPAPAAPQSVPQPAGQ
jgi:hypothetical protein